MSEEEVLRMKDMRGKIKDMHIASTSERAAGPRGATQILLPGCYTALPPLHPLGSLTSNPSPHL